MMLPPRRIIEPRDYSTTMRSDRGFCGLVASPAHLRRASDGSLAPIRAPFVGGTRRSTNGGPFVMQSDRKSRLITICMLASALVMIEALTGTLQMRVSHSPKLVSSQIDRS